MRRDPKKDPISGDVVSHPVGKWRVSFRVHDVQGELIYYWDEGLLDHVSLDTWRKWHVRRRGVRVEKRAGQA